MTTSRPTPEPDELTSPYWEAASRHELFLQRCGACGYFRHPPRSLCGRCGSKAIDWVAVSGRGEIYSFIVVRRLMIAGFNEPYVVALITPVEAQDDTVRIVSNIVDCRPEDVYLDMAVEVTFEDRSNGLSLPQFRPVEQKS